MVDSIPVSILVGTALGTLSGLGIGGGSLLILWLTMVLGMDQATARGINLLFFLPAAGIACIFRMRQGAVDLRRVLPAMLTGCIMAALGTWLSQSLDVAVLKKLFGGLLIVTGLREICYRNEPRGGS